VEIAMTVSHGPGAYHGQRRGDVRSPLERPMSSTPAHRRVNSLPAGSTAHAELQ
jgi:hypothetical protein